MNVTKNKNLLQFFFKGLRSLTNQGLCLLFFVGREHIFYVFLFLMQVDVLSSWCILLLVSDVNFQIDHG